MRWMHKRSLAWWEKTGYAIDQPALHVTRAWLQQAEFRCDPDKFWLRFVVANSQPLRVGYKISGTLSIVVPPGATPCPEVEFKSQWQTIKGWSNDNEVTITKDLTPGESAAIAPYFASMWPKQVMGTFKFESHTDTGPTVSIEPRFGGDVGAMWCSR